MGRIFDTFFARLASATDIATQQALATALGVNRSAITQAKNRDVLPQKWFLSLSRAYALSPDWLEFGRGPRHLQKATEDRLFDVPYVEARLSAGGGSLQVEAEAVETQPFPRAWLARKGNPAAMVLMSVVGDSMEPEIRAGDTVMVDQSQREVRHGAVHAVGYEDAILIKRVERSSEGICLISDNKDYSPVLIRGDELELFRVIGRVVWLGRDVR